MTTNTNTPAAGGTGTPDPKAPGAPAAGTPDPKAAGAGGTPAPAAGTPAPSDKPFEFKVPEGLKVEKALLEKFGATAKELKLDGTNGQKLLDVFLGQQKAQLEADEQRVAQQETKWAEEISKDKEFGGDKLAESRTNATKAVEKFGGENLAKLLKATGLDNNPDLFRTFARIGKAMAEDKVAGSTNTNPAAKKRDLQTALYGG